MSDRPSRLYGPAWLRRVSRAERAEILRARWGVDRSKPAPTPRVAVDRFGVSLVAVKFLEGAEARLCPGK
jgi:hypothetical protein